MAAPTSLKNQSFLIIALLAGLQPLLALLAWHTLYSENNRIWSVIPIFSLLATSLLLVLTIKVYRHGFIHPLSSFRSALFRLKAGELSFRLPENEFFLETSDLNKQFNEMAARLDTLEIAKTEFLSTISHELKTPLTAIKEGLVLLTEKGDTISSAARQKTIEIGLNSTKRLELLIQNLLNHSQLEKNFFTFDGQPKNFFSVVDSTIQNLKPIADRRKITIEVYTHTDLLWSSFSVLGLSHAIENLLMNAIKYADNSHPIVISIRHCPAEPVPFLELRITNHGRALLASEISQVFDRFFRAKNSEGQQGLGLGLSIVKSIVEAHQGNVFIESRDEITTFGIRIPQIHREAIPFLEGARNG